MALKHLVDLDLAGNEIQNVVLQNLATAPTGVEGQIFYDTAINAVKVHTGSGFVRIGASADGSTITESSGVFSVGTIALSNVDGLQSSLDGKVDDSQVLTNVPTGAVFTDTTYTVGDGGLTQKNFTSTLKTKLDGISTGATNTEPAAILYGGGNPELATGVTGAEVRTLIGAGTSSLALGSTASTALAGNTTTISSGQASAITANSAKVSMVIGSTGESAMAGDTRTISSSEITAITANSAKVGITSSQATAISNNSAKVSDTGTPAILSNGTVPSLNTGISAAEVRTLIDVPSVSDIGSFATVSYVDDEITAVLDAAPAALDTLNELAASLNDDADFAGTMTTALSNKLNSSAYTAADVLTKIKTVDGAGSGLDADKLDGQSSAYYRNYTNLTNKPSIPTFVSQTVTGASSGATDLSLGFGGYANIQIYDESGNLIMTEINQDGTGGATAQLTANVDFRVVAVGA